MLMLTPLLTVASWAPVGAGPLAVRVLVGTSAIRQRLRVHLDVGVRPVPAATKTPSPLMPTTLMKKIAASARAALIA